MRTPTRVVWDVFRSRADRLEPLYDDIVADIASDTRALFRDGDGISVEARNVADFAAGERQIVGTVKNALIDAAARARVRLHVDPERAAQRWVVRRSDNGDMTISIDLGGGSLSQRGWRRDAGDAPLREHLAAVLLMLCRFDPRTDALVDPMCGAGTIPIEAVLAARGAPRSTREFGKDAAALWPDASPFVVGCDIELDVLASARDNAKAARAGDAITWQRCDVGDLRPDMISEIALERGREPQTGVLLANPPYGERLNPDDLEVIYAAMAETMRRFRGWRAGFLVGNPLLERIFDHVVGRPRIKKPLANANLRAYFYLYEL
jgi:23S rRNA G2445 N2-methylase RlmL